MTAPVRLVLRRPTGDHPFASRKDCFIVFADDDEDSIGVIALLEPSTTVAWTWSVTRGFPGGSPYGMQHGEAPTFELAKAAFRARLERLIAQQGGRIPPRPEHLRRYTRPRGTTPCRPD